MLLFIFFIHLHHPFFNFSLCSFLYLLPYLIRIDKKNVHFYAFFLWERFNARKRPGLSKS